MDDTQGHVTDTAEPVDPSQPHLAQQLSDQPQQSPAPSARKPLTRRKTWLAASCVVALATCAVVGVTVWRLADRGRDSGVQECQLIASDKSAGGLSESKYQAARKRFSDSRYNDLRTDGVALMDIAWVSTRGGRDGASVADSGPFLDALAHLTTACANHGVTLPKPPPSTN